MEKFKGMIKTLVLQTAFLGDAILTLPLLQELSKKRDLFGEIGVLCIENTKNIFENSPAVNEVIVYDKRGQDKGIRGMLKLAAKIKELGFNKIISPHRSYRSAFLTFFTGIKDTVCFENSSLKILYRSTKEYDFGAHEVKRNLIFTGSEYSGESWRILPVLNISTEVISKINEIVKTYGLNDFITIAPGSVWETKKYPVQNFIELVGYFVRSGEKIVLIGSNSEKEICNKLEESYNGQVVNLCGKLTILESIELLKRTKLLISNDSAPVHFGMVADIPVLDIYCSTVPEFGFYPYNGKSETISLSNLSCKPCGIHGHKSCPTKTFDCGEKLLPVNIYNKANEMIYGRKKNRNQNN